MVPCVFRCVYKRVRRSVHPSATHVLHRPKEGGRMVKNVKMTAMFLFQTFTLTLMLIFLSQYCFLNLYFSISVFELSKFLDALFSSPKHNLFLSSLLLLTIKKKLCIGNFCDTTFVGLFWRSFLIVCDGIYYVQFRNGL